MIAAAPTTHEMIAAGSGDLGRVERTEQPPGPDHRADRGEQQRRSRPTSRRSPAPRLSCSAHARLPGAGSLCNRRHLSSPCTWVCTGPYPGRQNRTTGCRSQDRSPGKLVVTRSRSARKSGLARRRLHGYDRSRLAPPSAGVSPRWLRRTAEPTQEGRCADRTARQARRTQGGERGRDNTPDPPQATRAVSCSRRCRSTTTAWARCSASARTRAGAARSFGSSTPSPAQRILDVATGTGLVAERSRVARSARSSALDQSGPMLAAARARLAATPSSPPASRSSRARPSGSRSPTREFDALTFTYLLRYVDDRPATLRELARVVKPGGRIGMVEFGVPATPRCARCGALHTRVGLPLLGPRSSPRRGTRSAASSARTSSSFYAASPI